jgi:HlyD family secretion protein
MFRDTGSQDRPIEQDAVRSRRRILRSAGLSALLLVFLVGFLLSFWRARSSTSRSQLTLATVERGTFVRDVEADGRIVAADSPVLYAASAGSVHLLVHAGDNVHKGDLVARVDSPDLLAQSSQQQSALESARVAYERAKLDARVHQGAAEEAAARAEVDESTTLRELDRSRKAFSLGAYSELQVLRAEDAHRKAEFTLREAHKALETQPALNRFEISSEEALFERQKAMSSDLRRQVDALNVRSPIDGQVGAILVQDHAWVARDTPLLRVVDLSALEAEVQVAESFARDLTTGMPAVLSGNAKEFLGRVSGVSPEVVNGQVTVRVRFEAERPMGLRENQRMAVRILLEERKDAVIVDRGSFVDTEAGGFAYVVNGNVAERRSIRIGAVGATKIEILSGLRPGERVVVSGSEALGHADRVVISE